MKDYCGNSSVGRASRCQRECREFESRFPLQIYTLYRGDLRIRSGAGQGQALWLSVNPEFSLGVFILYRV